MDVLSSIIELLQPRAVGAKLISGAGRWGVQYTPFDRPSFCTVLSGSCLLKLSDARPFVLAEGDFILLPSTPGFVLSGSQMVNPTVIDAKAASSSTSAVHHGDTGCEPDVRLLGGYFEFESVDSNLLTSLMPKLIHVKDSESLSILVRLIASEVSGNRPGQDFVLQKLVEILLIEALRSSQGIEASAGLLRGLSDERLAEAMRKIHHDPAHPWKVEQLAEVCALSRSAFFDRFNRVVGIPPMQYLFIWRMALARKMLQNDNHTLDEIAHRVGYVSPCTFSMAFSRHTGHSPSRFAKIHKAQLTPGNALEQAKELSRQ